MKKFLQYLFVITIIVGLIIAGIMLRHHRQSQVNELPTPVTAPWALSTAAIIQSDATSGFPALALVKGQQDINISSQLNGILLKMFFREGDSVKKGDQLARIDIRELNDQLASLKAQHQAVLADFERKNRDADRAAQLLKTNNISKAQVDKLHAEANVAKEQANSLKQQIKEIHVKQGYSTVTAPFPGLIAARFADPGDLLSLGKPIYRLITTEGARLEIRLPAEVLSQVHIGTKVSISYQGKTISREATRIFPALDERSLGHIEIDMPTLTFNPPPGSLLPARVIIQSLENVLIVPNDAILKSKNIGQGWVFTVNKQDNTLARIPVKILLRAQEGIAIKGEVTDGDQVVVAHETTLLKLKSGDSILPSEPMVSE